MLGHAWSLGIEEKFYLVWPLLIVALFPFRLRSIALTVGAGGWDFVSAANCWRGRMAGCCWARCWGLCWRRAAALPCTGLLMRVPTTTAALLVLVGYVGMALYRLPVLFFSAGVTLLIGTLVLRRSWLRTLLEGRWIVTCGKRSYAMYLIHVLAINAVERIGVRTGGLRRYVVIPVAYGVSFLGATAIFYAVERPCVKYGRKVARGMRESLTKRLPVGVGLAG